MLQLEEYFIKFMDYFVIIFLVLLSGMFSGLTLGLLSLSKGELERKIKLGDKNAVIVYSVRKNGNLLLCTLLLGNVAVNSTLAIYLGDIANGFSAGIISTALIVIFGEILPQATFSRFALHLGAKTAWLVKIFIFMFYPFTWPIAKALDKILGEEMNTIYSKHELIKIVEEHSNTTRSDVDADEERIVMGALSFSTRTAEEVMTPRTVVYSLDIDRVLDADLFDEIKSQGYSRIPVYKDTTDNIVGVLYVKKLINIKLGQKIEHLYKKAKLLVISKDIKLDVLLNKFIKSKHHLAIIKNEYGGFEGVISLEDIIEEIIKTEIVDEDDTVVDLQKKALSSFNEDI